MSYKILVGECSIRPASPGLKMTTVRNLNLFEEDRTEEGKSKSKKLASEVFGKATVKTETKTRNLVQVPIYLFIITGSTSGEPPCSYCI